MEDMFWKFSHLGQQIIKKLSNKNLAKGKKVARSWEHFITNEKFYKQSLKFKRILDVNGGNGRNWRVLSAFKDYKSA